MYRNCTEYVQKYRRRYSLDPVKRAGNQWFGDIMAKAKKPSSADAIRSSADKGEWVQS